MSESHSWIEESILGHIAHHSRASLFMALSISYYNTINHASNSLQKGRAVRAYTDPMSMSTDDLTPNTAR